ncbi:hypothetical protein EK21DRAFT_107216 [Setomelanomma holmii]|uniref:Uncharacterized protein n=1 Tax=Setomelanomma holmii TaxID=210430 RepID=A0A9P4LPJ6_9PLEO|nr:hypothetical protein EK21DRAFT_107216 [Setomelanomma holmii]
MKPIVILALVNSAFAGKSHTVRQSEQVIDTKTVLFGSFIDHILGTAIEARDESIPALDAYPSYPTTVPSGAGYYPSGTDHHPTGTGRHPASTGALSYKPYPISNALGLPASPSTFPSITPAPVPGKDNPGNSVPSSISDAVPVFNLSASPNTPGLPGSPSYPSGSPCASSGFARPTDGYSKHPYHTGGHGGLAYSTGGYHRPGNSGATTLKTTTKTKTKMYGSGPTPTTQPEYPEDEYDDDEEDREKDGYGGVWSYVKKSLQL